MRRLEPVLILAALLFSPRADADEGMWLFNRPPSKQLKDRYGFEPGKEWLEHVQKSCLRVSTGGSGSIVSADGLVMTNHHVASDILAKLSTKDNDLLARGFFAPTRAEEAKCPDVELLVLWNIEDVTERVMGAAVPSMSTAEAQGARRKMMAAIEQESKEKSGMQSEVVTLYQGGRYHLYQYKRFTDIRLVFAPDKQAAFFGGDNDNFEYPRYCLDVTFLRIYENDRPLRPDHFLKWSRKGCLEGDLVFVAGHPGRTERLFTNDHLEFLRDVQYPMSLLRLWRREVQLATFRGRSEEWARIAEDDFFGVQNSRKAYTGLMAGILDPAIMNEKAQAERRLKAFVWGDGERTAKWGDAWDRVADSQKTATEQYERFLALGRLGLALGSDLCGIAKDLVRATAEKEKPNTERLREYIDANLETLEFQLFSPAPIYPELEVDRIESHLSFMAELLGGGHELLKLALAGRSPRARAEELVSGCTLTEVENRRKLYEGGKSAVDTCSDPMIRFMKSLDPEARALRKLWEDKVDSPQREGYAKLAAAKFALEGENVYPDATFTLRLAYGTVKGYEENGQKVAPFTAIAGLYERCEQRNGVFPFNLDPRWVSARSKLHQDTPFNFVHTCDIIGGNSGSPTIDKKGEVVGLIFDGNIQSLVLDICYTDVQSRAVSVDSRALIEALRNVYGAGVIAEELLGSQP